MALAFLLMLFIVTLIWIIQGWHTYTKQRLAGSVLSSPTVALSELLIFWFKEQEKNWTKQKMLFSRTHKSAELPWGRLEIQLWLASKPVKSQTSCTLQFGYTTLSQNGLYTPTPSPKYNSTPFQDTAPAIRHCSKWNKTLFQKNTFCCCSDWSKICQQVCRQSMLLTKRHQVWNAAHLTRGWSQENHMETTGPYRSSDLLT